MFHPSSQKSHMGFVQIYIEYHRHFGGWANAFSPQKNPKRAQDNTTDLPCFFLTPKKKRTTLPTGINGRIIIFTLAGDMDLVPCKGNTSNLHRSKLQLSRGQFLLDFLSPCGRWGHCRGSRWVAVHFNGVSIRLHGMERVLFKM